MTSPLDELIEKPVRPPKPAGMPMKGDDNSAWHAWRNACQMCRHSSAKYGCVRLGVVEYSNGRLAGFPQVHGGCNAWEPLSALSTKGAG